MSDLLNKFNSIEILRFFLHGLFVVFPISIFPNIVNSIGPIGFTFLIIFSGIILYSIPIDNFIPFYKKKYIEEINKIIKNICDKKIENPRALYDLYFYNEMGDNLRYRIHFYVSLYYLYSRIFISVILYSVLFIIILLCYFFEVKTSIFGVLFELNPFPYKLISILILCLVSIILSFNAANNIIKLISELEITNIKCNSNKIIELFNNYNKTKINVS